MHWKVWRKSVLKNVAILFTVIVSISSNQYFINENLDYINLYNTSFENHNSEEQSEEYLFFCNGVPCQNHDIKSVIKEITNEGRYIYFEPEELAQLDFSTLEDWQIIKYSFEELNELDVMPEDCTQSSVDDGTCGFGIRKEIEFVEYRVTNDPPLLKGIDMNPYTDVLHLEINPPFIESGYSLSSFGCKVQILENDILLHTYTQTVNELNCYFNIPNELQGDTYHLEIFTFVVFENTQTGQFKEIFRFMAEVGTND